MGQRDSTTDGRTTDAWRIVLHKERLKEKKMKD